MSENAKAFPKEQEIRMTASEEQDDAEEAAHPATVPSSSLRERNMSSSSQSRLESERQCTGIAFAEQ